MIRLNKTWNKIVVFSQDLGPGEGGAQVRGGNLREDPAVSN